MSKEAKKTEGEDNQKEKISFLNTYSTDSFSTNKDDTTNIYNINNNSVMMKSPKDKPHNLATYNTSPNPEFFVTTSNLSNTTSQQSKNISSSPQQITFSIATKKSGKNERKNSSDFNSKYTHTFSLDSPKLQSSTLKTNEIIFEPSKTRKSSSLTSSPAILHEALLPQFPNAPQNLKYPSLALSHDYQDANFEITVASNTFPSNDSSIPSNDKFSFSQAFTPNFHNHHHHSASPNLGSNLNLNVNAVGPFGHIETQDVSFFQSIVPESPFVNKPHLDIPRIPTINTTSSFPSASANHTNLLGSQLALHFSGEEEIEGEEDEEEEMEEEEDEENEEEEEEMEEDEDEENEEEEENDEEANEREDESNDTDIGSMNSQGYTNKSTKKKYSSTYQSDSTNMNPSKALHEATSPYMHQSQINSLQSSPVVVQHTLSYQNTIYSESVAPFNVWNQVPTQKLDNSLEKRDISSKKLKLKNEGNKSTTKDENDKPRRGPKQKPIEKQIIFEKLNEKPLELKEKVKKSTKLKKKESESENLKAEGSTLDGIIKNESEISDENSDLDTNGNESEKKKKTRKRANSKLFPCQFERCDKVFKRAEHLRRHTRIHTGEKPYSCKHPGCTKSFSRMDNLNQHHKVHLSTKQTRGSKKDNLEESKVSPKELNQKSFEDEGAKDEN